MQSISNRYVTTGGFTKQLTSQLLLPLVGAVGNSQLVVLSFSLMTTAYFVFWLEEPHWYAIYFLVKIIKCYPA